MLRSMARRLALGDRGMVMVVGITGVKVEVRHSLAKVWLS